MPPPGVEGLALDRTTCAETSLAVLFRLRIELNVMATSVGPTGRHQDVIYFTTLMPMAKAA